MYGGVYTGMYTGLYTAFTAFTGVNGQNRPFTSLPHRSDTVSAPFWHRFDSVAVRLKRRKPSGAVTLVILSAVTLVILSVVTLFIIYFWCLRLYRGR